MNDGSALLGGVTVPLVTPMDKTGRPDAEHATDLLAANAGADALVMSPPIYFHHREDEIVAHYAALATVGLPVIAYNAPRYSNPLTRDLIGVLLDLDADGIVPGVANIAPALSVQLIAAHEAGDHDEVRRLQTVHTELTKLHGIRRERRASRRSWHCGICARPCASTLAAERAGRARRVDGIHRHARGPATFTHHEQPGAR